MDHHRGRSGAGTADRLVAMKILRVNGRLIDQLSGQRFEDLSMRELLHDRTHNDYDNRYDDNVWNALESVVREMTRMER